MRPMPQLLWPSSKGDRLSRRISVACPCHGYRDVVRCSTEDARHAVIVILTGEVNTAYRRAYPAPTGALQPQRVTPRDFGLNVPHHSPGNAR
jgi:hypothetical protein